MHNLPLLLLDCLVVLMIIGSQSVSAQVLGAVYFRGSGSINSQAISPTRALTVAESIVHISLDVGGLYGIGTGAFVLVILCVLYGIYHKYYKRPPIAPT